MFVRLFFWAMPKSETINAEEPLLAVESRNLIPIVHHDIWALNKLIENLHWNFEKGIHALSNDLNDLNNKCTVAQRTYVEKVLAAFNGLDNIVIDNDNKMSERANIPELKHLFIAKARNECVHAETYGKLIEYYIPDPVRREEIFNACVTWPWLEKKMAWARKWKDNDDITLAQYLISSIITEGFFFQSSFVAPFYFKSRGLLHGLALYNEWISRDETLHAMIFMYLHEFRTVHKLDHATIRDMFQEAVDIEIEFALQVLPESIDGINATMMIEYIKYYADLLVSYLGMDPIYNSKNPFPFMVQQGIDGKANFFEREVTDYTRGIKVFGDKSQKQEAEKFDDDMYNSSLGGF